MSKPLLTLNSWDAVGPQLGVSIITVFSSPCSAAGPAIIGAKMPLSFYRFEQL